MSLVPQPDTLAAFRAATTVERETLDTDLQDAAQTLVDQTSLIEAAAALNVHRSSLERYLGVSPHKGDVVLCQLMINSYVELNGPP
jgi:hypothetical protein